MNNLSFALLVLLIPSLAFAARPFVTDDARLTTAGSCQLESWTRVYPNSQEIWALPACNLSGNLEFTVGGGRASYEGMSAGSSDYVFQAKTLIRQLETNGWGWGLAAGTIHHPEVHPGPNMLGNTYAYLPFSASMFDDRIIAHTNLGWLRDNASGLDSATWGIGGEFKLHSKLLGIAETFGDNRGLSYAQIGVRYSVLPDLFQIDATMGKQQSGPGNSNWISVGIRYTPDRLF